MCPLLSEIEPSDGTSHPEALRQPEQNKMATLNTFVLDTAFSHREADPWGRLLLQDTIFGARLLM